MNNVKLNMIHLFIICPILFFIYLNKKKQRRRLFGFGSLGGITLLLPFFIKYYKNITIKNYISLVPYIIYLSIFIYFSLFKNAQNKLINSNPDIIETIKKNEKYMFKIIRNIAFLTTFVNLAFIIIYFIRINKVKNASKTHDFIDKIKANEDEEEEIDKHKIAYFQLFYGICLCIILYFTMHS